MYFKPDITREEWLRWDTNKLINPRTRRAIKVGGAPYRELQKYYKKYGNGNDIDVIVMPLHKSTKAKKPTDKRPEPQSIPSTCTNQAILSNKQYIKSQSVYNYYNFDKHKTNVIDAGEKITYKNKDKHIEGREDYYYCWIDTYKSIHHNKFIMLKNKTCYDIEILMNHIICQYKTGKPSIEPGNSDPDTTEKIWDNMTDIKRLLAHRLIKNPNIIDEKDWNYTSKKFISNCKTFRSKVIKSRLKNDLYINLFDKHFELLLNINRLGFIFHTDQPSNYFNPDKIKFVNLDHLDTPKVDDITQQLMDILSSTYKKELQHIDDPDRLKHEVVDIFTARSEWKNYDEITKDLKHDFNDKINILLNVSYMYGLSQNFKESIQAKEDFLKHILTYDKDEQKLIHKLLKKIIKSNECIHLLGNRLKKIFIKYWFLYLQNQGISKSNIATQYIPIVYDKFLNDTMTVKSTLFEKNTDRTHGYYYTVMNGIPYWVNKMGEHGTWDGISLKDFTDVVRRSRAF